MKKLCCLGLVLLFLAPHLHAQQRDPASLPAKDSHEKVTIGCDPVTDAERSKKIFGKKHPFDSGLLAIEIIIRNDNDLAIKVDMDAIRLTIEPPDSSRQRLRALTLDDVVSAIVYKETPNPSIQRKRIPKPFPTPGADKSKDYEKVADIIRPLAFEMDLIPPRATVKGFLFFDMARKWELLQYSRLYIPDLMFSPSGKYLLFFELDLASIPR